MALIADGDLRDLRKQPLRILKQQLLHGSATAELCLKNFSPQAVNMAHVMHDQSIRGSSASQKQVNSHHALAANRGNLDGGSIGRHVLNGNNRSDGKVCVVEG